MVTAIETESVPTRDSARTLKDILDVASREFEDKGFAGARVDEIAEATRTSKRMIYYYFQSKEGLYIAVLEMAYRRIREIETSLKLENLDPMSALRTLTGFTFDYHLNNPGFVRLVMVENIHKGAFMARSEVIQAVNNSAIEMLDDIYGKGVAAQVFRPGLRAIDLHFMITAQSFYNVSNQATFAQIFGRDLDAEKEIGIRRANTIESLVRMVQA